MNIAESELKDVPPKSGSFHHILVATDFSRCSERALAEALTLAIENGADLSLVHVLRTDWRYEMLENPPEIDLELSDARARMDACVRKLPGSQKVQPVLITKGPIAKSLLRAAIEQPSAAPGADNDQVRWLSAPGAAEGCRSSRSVQSRRNCFGWLRAPS